MPRWWRIPSLRSWKTAFLPLMMLAGRRRNEIARRRRSPKKVPLRLKRRKIRSKKLILVHFSRTTSIRGFAHRARWRTWNVLHSKISSPSPAILRTLTWQLGSLPLRKEVRRAAELIVGNLNEDGYLIASDEELLGIAPPSSPETDVAIVENVVNEAAALGLAALSGSVEEKITATGEETDLVQ